MNLEKWYALKDKTAALTFRERLILLVVSLVCVLFIWAQFFYVNFEKSLHKAKQEITAQQQQQWDQSDQLTILMAKLAHDPNLALQNEQKALQDDLAALKSRIELRLSNLIEPSLMADVLRKVLSDYKGLQLIGARNLPVVPLKMHTPNKTVTAGANNSADKNRVEAVLFSHPFQMELKGDYFQALAFLKHLESMQGFYWTLLDYQVEDYPSAKIILQLSTLSLEEGWIGV